MRHTALVCSALLCSAPAFAVDRAIAPPPTVSMSWGYVTHNNAVEGHRQPAVGFWQRASGAKPGVGIVFAATMEYQLPETPPSHVRSATFQFSGKQSQCVGAEPVVIDVYAYAADGRGDKTDASAGTRVAQLRADCATNPAFNQPIDVTALVRQLSVPSGIRHIGFNMRKANNRQGPGLFGLSAGKLTVVVADEAIAHSPAPATPPAPTAQTPAAQTPVGPNGLIKALSTLARGGGTKAARDQAKGEALDGIANLPVPSDAPTAPATPQQPTQ
jgi:hypothetical protein